jgi:hypothetical protein
VDLGGPQVGDLDTTYLDYMSFTGIKVSRTYQIVSFALGDGTPDPSIGPHTFNASRAGQGEVSPSSVYAFITTANDEVRLSVGGKQTIEVDTWIHCRVSPVVKSARSILLLGRFR